MPTGQLVKITANRKLMIKINEATYSRIHDRLIEKLREKDFPTDRTALWTSKAATSDFADGDDAYFVMITLDRYDKQNMEKFEAMVKSDVAFTFKHKPHDFIPIGQTEQVLGINLVLTSIRRMAPKQKVTQAEPALDEVLRMIDAQAQNDKREKAEPARIASDPTRLTKAEKPEGFSVSAIQRQEQLESPAIRHGLTAIERAMQQLEESESSSDEDEFSAENSVDEVDRMILERMKSRPLNAEEEAIDKDVQAFVAEKFDLPAIADRPKLVRQNGVNDADKELQAFFEARAAPAPRRRRQGPIAQ